MCTLLVVCFVVPTGDFLTIIVLYYQSLFIQIGQLCGIAQYHMTPFVKDIFDVVQMFWKDHLDPVLNLVESLAVHVSDECTKYIPTLLPLILAGLKGMCK